MAEAKLTVRIENKRPIELSDFSESLSSLGTQYNKFLSESDVFSLKQETKLYVKEVRKGSIITELSDLVPLVLPFVENSNSVIEFTKFLKSVYDYFLGKTEVAPKAFDLKDCRNFSNIIKPVAKDNGSNVVFTGDFHASQVVINYNSVEANAIQNGIEREKERLKEPEKRIEKRVLFYWDSAKYDDKSKAIDRGFVEVICKTALRVTFDDDVIKGKMLDTPKNPFHLIHIVDVEVMEMKGNPTIFNILKLHESYLRDE